jgi:hypothetical protein
MLTVRNPKVIPPNSRVRLLRADRLTPAWQNEINRQFRIGYYNRKDGLDCIWLVNEHGDYEQSTDHRFLMKYFEVDHLSKEKNLYGRGKGRLRKIHVPTALERLNGITSIDAYEGAKEISQRGRYNCCAVRYRSLTAWSKAVEQGRSSTCIESHARQGCHYRSGKSAWKQARTSQSQRTSS